MSEVMTRTITAEVLDALSKIGKEHGYHGVIEARVVYDASATGINGRVTVEFPPVGPGIDGGGYY